jgi:pectin methylesterase-like acyl-CoA thioesterase
VENCSLISWQDTFLCKGYVWVHNSLIAGHVDYIWGYPNACLFEDCEIRSRAHFFSRVVFAMLSVFLYIAKYYLLKN